MTNKKMRSGITVLFMIFAMIISKFLGMLRGVLLASAYGIGEKATAFSTASRIPVSFFDIIFASAILGCFIPVYNSFSEDENKDKNEFSSIYLNFMLVITGAVALIGMVFAPFILSVIAPDISPETTRLATLLLRIMFPLIVFAAASYTLVGVLQSSSKFIAPAFISAVSNVLVIVYFLFFNKRFDIIGLAVSYTLGWVAQLLTLVFSLSGTGFKYRALLNFKNKAFIKALKLTPLIIMGSWLAPMCMLFSMRAAALTHINGAVPSFEYSINLFTVITGITTYGICNYIFPEMSKLASSNNYGEFLKTCKNGLSAALIMTLPIAACVFVLAPYGVRVVYMRGNFDVVAANQVTIILKTLVPGMIGFTLTEVLSRVFYARKTPKYPVISVVLGVLINALLLAALGKRPNLSMLGISYSAAILGAGVMMLVFASHKMKGFFDKDYFFNLLKIMVSGGVCAAAMTLLHNAIGASVYSVSFVLCILFALIIALCGIVVYFLSLILFRENNVKSLIHNFLKKG